MLPLRPAGTIPDQARVPPADPGSRPTARRGVTMPARHWRPGAEGEAPTMTLSTPTPDAGARALGRYLRGERIGRGATATVHRACDLATGADVAVKVIPVDL